MKQTHSPISSGETCAGNEKLDVLICLPFLVILLALLGLVLTPTLMDWLIPEPADLKAFLDSLTPLARGSVSPEPVERALFLILTLISPLLAGASLGIAGILRRHFCAPGRQGPVSAHASAGLTLLAGIGGLGLLRAESLVAHTWLPASPWLDLACGVLGAGLIWIWPGTGVAEGQRRMAFSHRRTWAVGLMVIAYVLVFLPRGLSLHSVLNAKSVGLSKEVWSYHFQAVAYTVSQAVAGKPILSGAPSLYGYYAAFLVPIFRLLPLSIFSFSMTMATLQAVALVAILFTAVRFIRQWPVAILCCATLLYTFGGTWAAGKISFDPYFQYWPIRVLFPALSLPLFLHHLRRRTWKSAAILGMHVGLGCCWNLDSGVAVAGAVIFTLGMECLGSWRWPSIRSQVARTHAARFVGVVLSAVLAAALFWLMLKVQASWKEPLRSMSQYQKLFFQSGYMMLPMPLRPHPWCLTIVIYLFGLAFGLKALWNARGSLFSRVSLFLSILGLGLFTYYQGRSHDYNLLSVMWPAILLGFLFTDRLFRGIRAGMLPRQLRWMALPAAYLGLASVLLLPGAVVSLGELGLPHWKMAMTEETASDPIGRRIAFIRTMMGNDRECVILTPLQAVYFMETGFRSAIDAPGTSDWFYEADLLALKDLLMKKPVRHLFADRETLEFSGLLESLQRMYRARAVSSDGMIWYLTPRTTPAQSPL